MNHSIARRLTNAAAAPLPMPLASAGECLQEMTRYEQGRLAGSAWAWAASFKALALLHAQRPILEKIARHSDYKAGWVAGALAAAEEIDTEPCCELTD